MGLRGPALAAVAALIGANLTLSPALAAERTYRSEHFALTWTGDRSDPDAPDLSDADGDGVPDSVTRMTRAFEDARAFLLDELGYRPPPTRGRYNLYLSSGIDGGVTRASPGGNGRSRPSFITIPKDMMRSSTPPGDVRWFAVHEYFHAVQLGYDAGEDPWIREASSAWVEGLFAPEVDHNQAYLHDFVPRLELGLRSDEGVREYGAFLFLQFLVERYGSEEGATLVRRLWEAMAVPEAIEGAPDDDSVEAITRVLAARGIALPDAWREFSLWAWQLTRFESGDEYKRALRAQRWPSAPPTPVAGETCRLTANAPDGILPELASDFARFKPTSSAEQNARVTVRGPAGTTAFALVRPPGGPAEVRDVGVDANGIGTLDVALGGRGAARVILGVGNAGPFPATIEYSARIEGENAVVAHRPSGASETIFGTAVVVSGMVECGGQPAPFARVDVIRTEAGSGTTETIETTTDAFGRWALVTAPAASSSYRVAVVDPLLSAASSDSATVNVRVAVNMTISDDQLEEGQPLTVEGNVAPVHAGEVILERRRPNGAFERAGSVTLDADGRYRFDHVLPGPGVWEVRVTMTDTRDVDHLPGDSAPKLVQVGET